MAETPTPPRPTGSGASGDDGGSRPGRFRRLFGPESLWHGVHFTGRSLITVGILIALFVAHQLWGTGLITAREQRELKADFREQLEGRAAALAEIPEVAPAEPSDGSEPGSLDQLAEAHDIPLPEIFPGDVIALIEIPAIGAEHAVVEGVGVSDLRRGPGHYPFTPLPGEAGNVGIAGHRTTYGAPFNQLDELEAGDEIRVATLRGEFTYRVTGDEVVSPRDVDVLTSSDGNRLTLTTCNPEYSSAERLVVSADLVGEPVEAAQRRPAGADDGHRDVEAAAAAGVDLDGTHSSGLAAVDLATTLTALAAAAVGALWWYAFRRRRRWYVWLAGLPPFLVALFFFFVQLEQVLPTSY